MRMSVQFLCIVLLSLVACKKDNEENASASGVLPSSNPNGVSFKANINGIPYQADSIFAVLNIDTTASFHSRLLGIAGFGTSHIVACGFEDTNISTTIPLNTFNFSVSMPTSFFEYYKIVNPDTLNEFENMDGILTITANDVANQKVSGTFHVTFLDYVTNDTVKITNGIFSNVPYSINF